MSLSSREKFIHLFVVAKELAIDNDEFIDWDKVHSMAHARCRDLSRNEINEIVDDLKEEQLGCYTAERYINGIYHPQKVACSLCDQEFLETDTLGKKQHEEWHYQNDTGHEEWHNGGSI